MMNIKTFTASIIAAFAILSASDASAYAVKTTDGQEDLKEFRDAVRLYEKGMVNRSRTMFDAISDKGAKADCEGYSVLCDVLMNTPGYELKMQEFLQNQPYSIHIPQIRYAHALNVCR